MKLLLLLIPIALLLISCGGGGYEGYQQFGYTIRGQHYQPMSVEAALDYDEVGEASWYDESKYFGLVRGDTSLGERVMPFAVSGAHKTLPIPCRVKVSNLENGKTVKLRLNDRGPFIPGRIIDVTPRAAGKLGFKKDGLAQVRVEVLSVGDGRYKRKAKRGWWPFW
ncbi:septal ring lytic transglycosylase RlpA family protein [Akkermansiaceae bacterium]|nr:septal ring lytic transglycosylase RlpA family protein [Akkermansiaceae bacterium]MDB4507056.1 septal ring lytic transglycosylase RlpA family protein [Akkermansiaceae bacterium]MDB4724938.1 septal ring lytic transglycosylase RlpA family protein [Akkermansiaceae bacterium]